MAPRHAVIGNGDTPPSPRRKVRRRRMTRQTTGGGMGTSRSGAATGVAPILQAGVNYDSLSAHIRGTVDGFALANHITSAQAFTGLKKALVW